MVAADAELLRDICERHFTDDANDGLGRSRENDFHSGVKIRHALNWLTLMPRQFTSEQANLSAAAERDIKSEKQFATGKEF